MRHSTRQSSASSRRRRSPRRSRGSCSGRPPSCRSRCGSARCSGPRSSSPTSPIRSTPTGITTVAPRRPRSRSSSTATSSARSAARPSPSSASCSPTSATSGTSGAICRSPTCTRTPRSRRRPRRQQPHRGGSGRCTTCSSHTRTRSGPRTSSRYAEELGLDVERFTDDLRRHEFAGRVAEDVDSADLSTVSGTPTFFVNDVRHQGAYDIETLSAAVRAARARASIAA